MSSTSELLQCIESKANWLKQDATSLTDLVSALKIRRDFPTLAEAAMDMAEAELIDALQKVRKARAVYLSRPAECDPYIVGEYAHVLDPDLVRRQVENLKLNNPQVFEDDELWALTLESETDLNELLTKIVRRIEDTRALASGTKERLQDLAERKARFENRMESLRSLVFKLMDATDLHKLELAEATLSIRNVPPAVVIVDEDQLPDLACKYERKPDKTKIKDLLSSGIVPGAAMSNGGKTISIRIK